MSDLILYESLHNICLHNFYCNQPLMFFSQVNIFNYQGDNSIIEEHDEIRYSSFMKRTKTNQRFIVLLSNQAVKLCKKGLII